MIVILLQEPPVSVPGTYAVHMIADGGGGGKGEGGEVAVPTPIGGDGGAPTMEPA